MAAGDETLQMLRVQKAAWQSPHFLWDVSVESMLLSAFGRGTRTSRSHAVHNLGIVWLMMNNNAFGTITSLQKPPYGLPYGTTFPGSPDARQMARDTPRLCGAMASKAFGSVPQTRYSRRLRPPSQVGKPRAISGH